MLNRQVSRLHRLSRTLKLNAVNSETKSSTAEIDAVSIAVSHTEDDIDGVSTLTKRKLAENDYQTSIVSDDLHDASMGGFPDADSESNKRQRTTVVADEED